MRRAWLAIAGCLLEALALLNYEAEEVISAWIDRHLAAEVNGLHGWERAVWNQSESSKDPRRFPGQQRRCDQVRPGIPKGAIGDRRVHPNGEGRPVIGGPNRKHVVIRDDLRVEGQLRPQRRIKAVITRHCLQQSVNLGGRIHHGNAFGGDESPQTHERVDRRVHRQEIDGDNGDRQATNPALGPATVIGAHRLPENRPGQDRVTIQQRRDSHRPQVGLGDGGGGLRAIGQQVNRVPVELSTQPFQEQSGRIDVLAGVGDVLRRDDAVLFGGDLAIGDPERLACGG